MHENSRSSSNFLGERRSHGSRMLIERGRRRLVQKSRRTTIGLGVPRSVEAAAGADDGGEGSPAITSSSEKKKGGMHHYEEVSDHFFSFRKLSGHSVNSVSLGFVW
ncbi:hypothetical protein LINPERPRIM_LOCUS6514, partial [Linum perenne]